MRVVLGSLSAAMLLGFALTPALATNFDDYRFIRVPVPDLGDTSAYAMQITDQREVVGQVGYIEAFTAFYWKSGASWKNPAPAPIGGPYSYTLAAATNGAGLVAGVCRFHGCGVPFSEARPYIYDIKTSTYVWDVIPEWAMLRSPTFSTGAPSFRVIESGLLGVDTPEGSCTFIDVNSYGLYVGSGIGVDGERFACGWHHEGGFWNISRDFGTKSTQLQLASAVNNLGDVVGTWQSTASIGLNGIFMLSRDKIIVPEPATWLSMIIGFGFVGGMLRRYHRQMPAAAK
jgi:hypothetical protein